MFCVHFITKKNLDKTFRLFGNHVEVNVQEICRKSSQSQPEIEHLSRIVHYEIKKTLESYS